MTDTPTAGGAPATTPAPTQSTESQPSSSATTQNIDYGMGPGMTSQATQPTDVDDDTFFKQHGERIFKHPRFKELTGYKQKFEEFTPVNEFVTQFGGLDELQRFSQYLGPVYKHLMGKGEQANDAWQKILPVLNKFLSDEDFALAEAQADESSEEEVDPKYKQLTEELNSIKGRLSKEDEMKRTQSMRSTAAKYEQMMNENFSKEGLPDNLKNYAKKLIISDIYNHMPKGANGRPLNPLENFSEQAFNSTWEKTVLAFLKDAESYYKDRVTKKIDNSGPAVPDTSRSGKPPAVDQGFEDRHARAARLAQKLGGLGK